MVDEQVSKFVDLLDRDAPSDEECLAVKGRYYESLSARERAVVSYVNGCYEQISTLCRMMYGRSEYRGPGDSYSYEVQGRDTEWSRSEALASANLVPVPVSYNPSDTAGLLSYVSLYTDRSVLVLPWDVQDSYISYSGSGMALGRMSVGGVLQTMSYNRLYRDVIRQGHSVFLPKEAKGSFISLAFREGSTAAAPFHQSPGNTRFTPINVTASNIAILEGPETVVVGKLLLPYFRGARLQDLVRIKETESDAFIIFGAYLRRRLSALAESRTVEDIEEILEDIQVGVARLNLEAKKVASSGLIRNAEIGAIGVSVVSILLAGSPVLSTLAGLVGSAGLLDLLRTAAERRRAAIDLRKNEYFVPFLLSHQATKG